MKIAYGPDYDFLVVSDDGRLLCITHEDLTHTYFRDADSGMAGKIKTVLLNINLRSGWWQFSNEEFDQARVVANAKRQDRRHIKPTNKGNAKYYLVTHTGNVLAVTVENQLGIQYCSLITQQSAALCHDDVRQGIDEQGWMIINDLSTAQMAATMNEESFWEQGGGWI